MRLPPLSYNVRSLFVRWSSTLLTVVGIGATVAVLATVDLSRSGQLIGSAMGLGVAAFAALQLRLR